MADITDPQAQKILRTIVREETADMRDDISVIKQTVGQHSIQLRTLNSSVNSLKTGFRHQTEEMTRLGTLLEDLDDRFRAAAEVK